jgi:group I intron endonuclease
MIYKITNRINGDFYIGYSLEPSKRFVRHKRNARIGQETYLYNAMRKYGIDNFIMDIIDENGSYDSEKTYIAELSPVYNMTAGGEGGDTSLSPNFKKAMAEYHSKKTKENYATYGMLGKKQTDKTKVKQSQAHKRNWKNLTEEERKVRSNKITGSKNGMYGKVPKNTIQVIVNGIQYQSKAQAQRETGKSWYYIMKNYEVIINGNEQETK